VEDVAVHRIDRAALGLGRQLHALDERLDARDIVRRDHAEARADISRANHADGDGLAVVVAQVARLLLDGVRHRVAEVQDAAQAALLLVLADDGRLDLARARDHVDSGLALKCEHRVRMLLEVGEEVRIVDDAVLDDLAEPRRDLALRQRFHHGEVHEDALGLVERADEVLAERVVDGHLAADARVDLRQKARRQLHERHAAHVRRRDEAREVADDAAAEREDRRLAVEAELDGPRVELLGDSEALGALPCRDRHDRHVQAACLEDGADLLTVERPDIAVRHEHGLLREATLLNE